MGVHGEGDYRKAPCYNLLKEIGTRRFSVITFTMYAYSKEIGKLKNTNLLG
jgi:hypothetical protein